MEKEIQSQYFNYKIVETFPLSELEKYKDHRRLMVFYHKGTECINPECNIVGTQLAVGVDNGGNKHVDVYTDDFYPLTIDHTLPKSLGGLDTLENLEPMCCLCNWGKGNGQTPNTNLRKKHEETTPYSKIVYTKVGITIGDEVYVKGGRKYRKKGIVDSFCVNPHTNRDSVLMENKVSMHRVDVLYKLLSTP